MMDTSALPQKLEFMAALGLVPPAVLEGNYLYYSSCCLTNMEDLIREDSRVSYRGGGHPGISPPPPPPPPPPRKQKTIIL